MQRIGFIGLGNMGAAMAARLIAAGQDLLVLDLDRKRMAEAENAGARLASSAVQIGENADIVFACLPTCEASLAVAREVMSGNRTKIYVETSTIGRPTIAAIADMAAHQVAVVDAPVSGGPSGASAGTLAVMVAGPDVAIQQIAPLLKIIGGKIFRVGEQPGLAQVCKLVNNAVFFTNFVVSCEAMVLGVKAGIYAETLLSIINASSGRNSATVDTIPSAILPGTFNAGGLLGGPIKDLKLYLDEVDELRTISPSVRHTDELWRRIMDDLDANSDYTNLIRFFERVANVQVREKATL